MESAERREILEYYSKVVPVKSYTEVQKRKIAEAVFNTLTEEQREEKIKRLNWNNPPAIQELCKQKYLLPYILKKQSGAEEKMTLLEEKIGQSMERQKNQQEMAIQNHVVQRIRSYTSHTITDKLTRRAGDAENKYQISRTPLYEDDNTMQHRAIEKHPEYQGDGYEAVIRNSVYDIEKMPIGLVDLALHGKHKGKYQHAEKLEVMLAGADRIEDVKTFLINAKPLQYPHIGGSAPEYTQRILALNFAGKKAGYLISENTPSMYAAKALRKYTNNFIRYQIFADKSALIRYLEAQLPSAMHKEQLWEKWKNVFAKYTHLQETYKHPDLLMQFQKDMESIKSYLSTSGATIIEQNMRDRIASLHYKNHAADAPILVSLRKIIEKGLYNQGEKLDYLKTHIRSLKEDPHF